MISLSDLVTVSPVRSVAKVSNQQSNRPERSTSRGRDRDHLTAQQEFCCPQAGTQLSVNKDFSLSASSWVRGGGVGRPLGGAVRDLWRRSCAAHWRRSRVGQFDDLE